MSLYSFKNKTPVLGKGYYIADGARVIGEASLGDNVNIWFNTVIRADVNFIEIGVNTNIQDLCMLHVTAKHALVIAENVSVGHSVILHGCRIGKGCLIGMGAKILDGAVIGENSLVAAGSVVPPGKVYPSGSMIMGAPAKVTRELSTEEIKGISGHYSSYVNYAHEFDESCLLLTEDPI